MSDKKKKDKNEILLAEIGLTHARSYHQWFADQRPKNFQFFLLIFAAVIAAVYQMEDSLLRSSITAFASVIGVMFYLLDKRHLGQIKDARHYLYQLEKVLEVELHSQDQLEDPRYAKYKTVRKWERMFYSHTRIYRTFYLLSAAFFLAITLGFV